jgi:hypothetical protein
MPALRRSARNAQTTSEKASTSPPVALKRKTKRKVHYDALNVLNIAGADLDLQAALPAKGEPSTPAKSASVSPRKPDRAPLADRQLEEDTQGRAPAQLDVAKGDSDNPLGGFGDRTISTIDESFQAHDEAVHDAISSWQAQSAKPPSPRRGTLSSSLPPSSPPSPLSLPSVSDLEDLGPTQNDVREGTPDPFGFFEAQKKIRARRKEVSPGDIAALLGPTTASIESPEPSFSDGEAFAAPSRARSHSSSLSDPISEKRPIDKGKGKEYSNTTTEPATRPKRTRIRAQALLEEEESEDEPIRRQRGKHARKINAKPLGKAAKTKPVARRARRGKAAAPDDDETEKVNIPSEKDSDNVCRWHSNETPINFSLAQELESRDQRVKAKLRRVAEFKELDDYKLEVENVIVF